MTNQRNGFNGFAIAVGTVVAIGLVALLLSAAMQVSGWMFIGLIVGIVAIVALVAWLIAFINQQRVKWIDSSTKAEETRNNFTLNLLKIGYLPDGRGGYKPIQQLPAPAPKPKEVAPADPRKQLLIELCLMTIRSNKRDEKTNELLYGPGSKRLMTADDAQEISKARGGLFADRTAWEKASRYAQENFLIYEKRGGKEQGMMVDQQRVGGDTVADLMSVLMRNQILDSAVNALPGIDR